jgi:hypothetical protein
MSTVLRRAAFLALWAVAWAPAACAPALRPRPGVLAPYAETQVWAVAPPLNESGVSIVDPARVADAIAREVQQVEGLEIIAVNRVLDAMDRLAIQEIASEGQARAVLDLLGADALLVGSITAWDPYPPLTLGLSLELYGREAPSGAVAVDPVAISRVTQGEVAPGQMSPVAPLAYAAGVFDGRDHQTLLWLDEYAESRHEPEGAYGRGVYLVSMDLFTQFVGHRLVRDLLQREQARMGTAVVNQTGR